MVPQRLRCGIFFALSPHSINLLSSCFCSPRWLLLHCFLHALNAGSGRLLYLKSLLLKQKTTRSNPINSRTPSALHFIPLSGCSQLLLRHIFHPHQTISTPYCHIFRFTQNISSPVHSGPHLFTVSPAHGDIKNNPQHSFKFPQSKQTVCLFNLPSIFANSCMLLHRSLIIRKGKSGQYRAPHPDNLGTFRLKTEWR